MKVLIRFRGPLAARTQDEPIEIDIEGSAVLHDVLNKTLSEVPSVKDLWQTPEQMDREALLLKNGTDIGLFEGLRTIIEEGDKIDVLPLVHGG